MEAGEYFNEDGSVRQQQLGLEYIKCSSWELYPTVKGQPPLDSSVAFEETKDQLKRPESIDQELEI